MKRKWIFAIGIIVTILAIITIKFDNKKNRMIILNQNGTIEENGIPLSKDQAITILSELLEIRPNAWEIRFFVNYIKDLEDERARKLVDLAIISLVNAIDGPDINIKLQAIVILAEIGTRAKTAVPRLRKVLEEADDVRVKDSDNPFDDTFEPFVSSPTAKNISTLKGFVIYALGNIKSEESLPTLRQFLNDRCLGNIAEDSIKKIKSK